MRADTIPEEVPGDKGIRPPTAPEAKTLASGPVDALEDPYSRLTTFTFRIGNRARTRAGTGAKARSAVTDGDRRPVGASRRRVGLNPRKR